jgi:hypothetical protein
VFTFDIELLRRKNVWIFVRCQIIQLVYSFKWVCCAEFNSFSLAMHLNESLTQFCCVKSRANGPGSRCRRQPMRNGYFVITEAPETYLFDNITKRRLNGLKGYERLLPITPYSIKLSKTAKRSVKRGFSGYCIFKCGGCNRITH